MSLSKVFLSPQEAERVRTTLKGNLQKCDELAGQPRQPGDSKARMQQVTSAAFMADIADAAEPDASRRRRPETLPAYALGRPYPPCTAPLEELKPMTLSELCMETHHRGRVLTVRRVAEVVNLTARSWTVVKEEESGETERLEVLLHKSRHGQDILESGSFYRIKEPYFTLSDQRDPTLRVDHPSDLIVCADAPDAGEQDVGVGNPPPDKTPAACKEEGNAALRQKDLAQAHACYSQGLQILTAQELAKDPLANDLHRNRALVNLGLNRLDEARSDAVASLTGLQDQKHKDLDGKALFRAGNAAYGLGDFQEARRLFSEQQKLTPGDKDGATNLQRAELRLKEQTSCEYNFRKIKAGVLLGRHQVDAATCPGSTKVKKSPGRGRGLFATRNIDVGQVVICEKAFCLVWGHEVEALTTMTFDDRDERIRLYPAGLCKAVVQKLLNNPSQIDRVMALYSDYKGLEKRAVFADSGPVVDVFQVHDIVSRNAFGPGPVPVLPGDQQREDDAGSAGLWPLAAHINHSCVPNVDKEYIGDLMIVRATRPIKAGEELFHSYDASSDYEERSESLMRTWGFACACPLCVAEKADDPEVRKRRKELESQANALMQSDAVYRNKAFAVLKAKRMVQSIGDTYDEKRYKGLPRTALVGIIRWLEETAARS